MSGTKALSLAFPCLLVQFLAAPADAQILVGYPTISISTADDCTDAPVVCGGRSFLPEPGTFDVFVYPTEGLPDQVFECAFGLTWPAEWLLLNVDVCAGTIIEGGISTPGDGIRLRFNPPILGDRAVLRLRLTATSIGRLQFTRGPAGAYGMRCPALGDWWDYIGGGWGRFPYVDVGDLCGGVPGRGPCDKCWFIYGDFEPSAVFTPSSLTMNVEQGAVGTAVLDVYTHASCLPGDECGGGPVPLGCYSGFHSRTSWLGFVELGSPSPGVLRYEVRLDATSLLPGLYYGEAEAEPATDGTCCAAVCWPLELTVVPSTTAIGEQETRPASWGEIKATYR